MTRRVLRLYGWLFAGAGLAFVFGSSPLTSLINQGSSFLPWARPLEGASRSLWLGVTGSLMAAVSYLSFALAQDPGRRIAWNCLLLAKAVSTALFAIFSAMEQNTLFLLGFAVDGAIFAHLFALRQGQRGEALLATRWDGGSPFYEVWFAKMNEASTGNALWLRYALESSRQGASASCWYALFDRAGGRVTKGRWEAPISEWERGEACPFRLGESRLKDGGLQGRNGGISWDLSWKKEAPAFRFIPSWLSGLLPSEYVSPAGLARFSGRFLADQKEYLFQEAPGSLGHLWGRRMAQEWRWAHAVFAGGTVFEIVSARVRLGPWLSPPLTSANLWHEGRIYRSSPWSLLMSGSRAEAGLWLFRVSLGDLTAEGECGQDHSLLARLEYSSPEGRRLACDNSKTGFMRLRLSGRDGASIARLENPDSAAVEEARGIA